MGVRVKIPSVGWDDEIPFGQWQGQTLREVLGADPGYLIWAAENQVLDMPVDALDQAYADVGNETEFLRFLRDIAKEI